MNRVSRWTLTAVSGFLTLLLVSTISLILIAYSTEANRYVLKRVSQWVPGLQINIRSGSLMQTLAFDLVYDDDTVTVTLKRARLNLSTTCFWQLHVCIENLQANELSVNLKPPSAEPDATKPEPNSDDEALPGIPLPFLLRLEQSHFVAVNLTQGEQVYLAEEDVSLQGRWFGHTLNVAQFESKDEFCRWGIQGEISFKEAYPIKAIVNCSTQLGELDYLSAEVTGDLNELKVLAASRGPLAAQIQATVSPLGNNLPVNFTAKLRRAYDLSSQGAPLTITEANVAGKGNLVDLRLSGSAKTSQQLTPNPVSIEFKAQFTPEQLELTQMLVTHASDRLTTRGQLRFDDGLSWIGETDIQSLNLAWLQQDLPEHLDGQLQHRVTYHNNQLSVISTINQLTGKLHNYELSLTGNAQWQDSRLQVSELVLTQADNTIEANGYWSEASSDMRIKLAIENLHYLLPELQGSLRGPLQLQGSLAKPAISAHITAENLSYNDISVARFSSDWQWQTQADANNHINVKLENVSTGEFKDYQLALDWQGQLSNHQIAITGGDTKNNSIRLACDGVFAHTDLTTLLTDWQANCEQWDITLQHPAGLQQWALAKPFTINVSQYNNIRLSPWCLGWQQATICNKQQALLTPNTMENVSLSLQQFQLDWAQPWLPDHLLLEGNLDVELTAKGPWSSWQVQSDAHSQQLKLTVRQTQKSNKQQEAPLIIELQQAQLSATSNATKHQLNWTLNTKNTGSSEGQLSVSANRELNGKMRIESLLIEPYAEVFLTDEDDLIKGEVNGNLRVKGTLEKPIITGDFAVTEGAVYAQVLPFPLHNIAFKLQLNNQRALVDGDFLIAEEAGHIKGFFDWSEAEWQSAIHFTAGVIPYRQNDDILVHIQPDIEFKIAPNAITLAGTVHIPKTRIYLKALPEQAVSSSPDEVVIGAEETGAPFEVSTDITLSLGDDVYFSGFGLETHLTGTMNIKQSANDLMRAKGIIRLQDGTYQAYGQSLVITNGDLIFIDDIENPQLRLSARRDKVQDDVEVGIRVTGRAREPKIALYSVPAMPQQEKLHYLLTGRAPNTDSDADSSRLAAETALSMALESQSTNARKAGSKLGIEDLTITADSTDEGSQVGFSGYITPDLMIRYGVGMFDAVNSITLNYRLRKNLYLEVISGKSNAFDILYSFDRD